MSIDPFDVIAGITDSNDVPKSELAAYEKARNVARFESVNEVNNTDLSARYAILVGSYIYIKTASVEADNGSTILVSLDGARWYRVGVSAVNWRGNWSVLTTYQIGDGVTYNDSSYVATTADNLAHIPAPGSAYWQVNALAGSPGGPISIEYTFATSTTDSDPGAGFLRLNNATQASATVIRADLLDNLGNTWTGVLDSMDDSTSTIKGFFRLQHKFDETKFLQFSGGAVDSSSGYRNITVTNTGYGSAGTSPFAAGDPLILEFVRNGDKGDPGTSPTVTIGTTSTLAEGTAATAANSGTPTAVVLDLGIPRGVMPATGFNFDTTTTDSDPGNGKVRFNNATPASVTAIYFDNLDRDGNTVTGWLDSFDDSSSAGRGTLTFVAAAMPAVKLTFAVSGTVVDGTGYRKVTVAWLSGATLPSNAAHLGVTFAPKGDVGAAGANGTASLTVCRAVATTNYAIASAVVNGASMDGVTLATGDRVLLTGQTAPAENGVYIVAASGAASRDSSFATYDTHPGILFSVQEGTTNADTLWHVTSDLGGTINVTALAISKVTTSGGSSDPFAAANLFVAASF